MSADFQIVRAHAGAPTVVECKGCGEVWVQPANDPTSSTLSTWAGAHVCQPQLFAVAQ